MTPPSNTEQPRILPRVLALTSQYPNAAHPGQAAFNRQQFIELGRRCELSVVAPLPWKQTLGPGVNPVDPLPGVPGALRPTFWYLPRIKRQWHGAWYLKSVWPTVRKLAGEKSFDVMLATWLFPDGWAAAIMAHRLGLPLVIKLHGSDVLVQSQDPRRRPKLGQALEAAERIVAVSQALARGAVGLGADEAKVRVVPNGIDRDLFRPGHRLRARMDLGLDPHSRYLLFLGRLEQVKGPDLAIEALAQLDDVHLIMVGAGSLEASLRSAAARLGIEDRVIFAGECEHKDVPRYLAASDLLLLPSRSEGQPNAVLEALSTQRPVVATSVGGVPELIEDGRQGALCPPEDPAALAQATARVLAKEWNPRDLSEPLGQRSWATSAEGLMAVLNEAIAGD